VAVAEWRHSASIAGDGSRFHEGRSEETIVTKNELLNQVLRGVLVIVGEYRGSHAEEAGYVDKKSGNAIQYVRATHVVECSWHGHIDRVIISEPAKIILLTNTSLALRSPKLPLLK
jgi:hypothetical protein